MPSAGDTAESETDPGLVGAHHAVRETDNE